MKYHFIDQNAKCFTVRTLCRVLEVPPASYYQWASCGRTRQAERDRTDHVLTEKIKALHRRKRRLFGSPRIADGLRLEGTRTNRKKVAKLMQRAEIRAKQAHKFKQTTIQNKQVAKESMPPDLVQRNFTATERNRLWTSDITYIWTIEGWLYLAIILDVFSRRIVGYQMSDRITAKIVTDALTTAVINRLGNGEPLDLIFHSDRGSQYTSSEVMSLLARYDIRQSMGRTGSCYDNAISESFFHTLKTELIQFEQFSTREEARRIIFEYIEGFYNRERSHSSIGYCSPVQFELINSKP
jgi:transposase InsO family protein